MKLRNFVTTFSFLVFAIGLLANSPAIAACSSPTGNAGDIVYSSTSAIMVYCNGTSWVGMGQTSAVSFGTLTSPDFCTATSGTAISCSTAPTGTGNVVLSSSPTLTGTLGGASSTWTGQVAIGTTTLSGALNISGTATATTFSGAFSGNGSGLTGIGTASLGGITGTPSSTTFLAGNGTWTTALTGLPSLTSADIWVGNGSNAATAVALSGDCALANTGAITCTKTSGTAFSALATATTVNLATQVAGGLGIANGGTNSTSQTSGGVNYYNGTNITSGTGFTYTGSNVGIGTATPTATLTVNGTHVFQFGTNYSTTGTQSDVAINGNSAVRYVGVGTAMFNGIVAGYAGQTLYLHNGSTSTLTLANQASADTTYANQIVTGTGANLSVASNSAVILQYDTTATNSNGASGAWRVIGGSGGGATPAGATGQVQYNSGSNSLAAGNNFTFLSATNELVVGTGAASPVTSTGTVASATMNFIPQAIAVTPATSSGGVALNTAATGQMAYYSGASTISGTPDLYVSGSNIGIGTSTPTNLLSLTGQGAEVLWMEREYTASTPGNSLTVQAGGAVSGGSNLAGGNLVLSGGTSTGSGTSQIQFKTFPGTAGSTSDNTAATAMTITGGGNVGIGLTNPQARIQTTLSSAISSVPAAGTYGGAAIFGNDLSAYGLYVGSISNGNGYIQQQRGDTATTYNLLLQPNGGNVGIGTTTPFYTFDVRTGTDQRLVVRPASNFISSLTGIGLQSTNDANNAYKNLDIEGNQITLNSASSGYVGIGTNAPQATLDVEGGNVKMGYTQVTNTCAAATACIATCPGSEWVLSGGCSLNSSWSYIQSYPNSYGSWWCMGYTSAVTVFAVCANMR